jgi:Txe/YoeB family toxin of toxin-antitoxin system
MEGLCLVANSGSQNPETHQQTDSGHNAPPFEGIGKPEALRKNLPGFWSRRIDESNRLVYAVDDNRLRKAIQIFFH